MIAAFAWYSRFILSMPSRVRTSRPLSSGRALPLPMVAPPRTALFSASGNTRNALFTDCANCPLARGVSPCLCTVDARFHRLETVPISTVGKWGDAPSSSRPPVGNRPASAPHAERRLRAQGSRRGVGGYAPLASFVSSFSACLSASRRCASIRCLIAITSPSSAWARPARAAACRTSSCASARCCVAASRSSRRRWSSSAATASPHFWAAARYRSLSPCRARADACLFAICASTSVSASARSSPRAASASSASRRRRSSAVPIPPGSCAIASAIRRTSSSSLSVPCACVFCVKARQGALLPGRIPRFLQHPLF